MPTESSGREVGPSGYALDSSLLTLAVLVDSIGDEAFRYKRVRDLAFDPDSWSAVSKTWLHATRWLTCPAVLAEVSNLAGGLSQDYCRQFRDTLAAWLNTSLELWDRASDLIRDDPASFLRLGYADAALVALAARGHHVVTADGKLYNRLYERGFECTNINHLRTSI